MKNVDWNEPEWAFHEQNLKTVLYLVCVSPVDGVVFDSAMDSKVMIGYCFRRSLHMFPGLVTSSESVKYTTLSPSNQHFLPGTAVNTADKLLESQETASFSQTTFYLATSMIAAALICARHTHRHNVSRWQSRKVLWTQECVFKGQSPTIECRKNGH